MRKDNTILKLKLNGGIEWKCSRMRNNCADRVLYRQHVVHNAKYLAFYDSLMLFHAQFYQS